MSETPLPPDNTQTAPDLSSRQPQRFVALFAAVAVGMALFGFMAGLREPARAERYAPPASDHYSAPPAVSYSELPFATLRPNVGWDKSLSQLKFDKPEIFSPVVRTEEMKLAALADRAKNRAYDGAPPTVPHPVDSQSAASCLACHGEGIKVGDRVASKISHSVMTNCTQCHVEQSKAPVETSFVGVYRAGPGERANRGAPPTIPHQTWMRENCNSCHGLVTRPGTRTTHPWLSNCLQCHAPSAAIDQVEFTGVRK